MGSFYTNITLQTEDRTSVTSCLRSVGRAAYLSGPSEGAIVVFDRLSEDQNPEDLADLAAKLSERCNCAAIAVTIHDDDVMSYLLYSGGAILDRYTSAPGYFDGEDVPPSGGDASMLATAFMRPDAASIVDMTLRAGPNGDSYVFETERHEALVLGLGLPRVAVGSGYTYIASGEYPAGLTAGNFIHVK